MEELEQQALDKRDHWADYKENQVEKIDAIYKTNPTCRLVRRAMVSAVKAGKPPGLRLLDVGCGTGEVAIAMHDEGFDVTGLDISLTMLAKCKENQCERDIDLVHGDVFSLPSEQMFDVATSRYVFSHYEDFSTLLKQIADRVVSGGLIVFDSFSSDPLKRTAETIGLSKKSYGRRVYSKLAHFGHGDLVLACERLGLKLESRRAASFFHRNPWFTTGYESILDYDKELERHLQDPAVEAFMDWFHSRVAPTIDATHAGHMINVVRKI